MGVSQNEEAQGDSQGQRRQVLSIREGAVFSRSRQGWSENDQTPDFLPRVVGDGKDPSGRSIWLEGQGAHGSVSRQKRQHQGQELDDGKDRLGK